VRIGVAGISQLLGFSRQSYYKHRVDRAKRHQELVQVRDLVMRIRSKMPRIGTRKLFYLIRQDLKRLNIKMGRDVLFDFLRAEHLLIKPKRSYVKTTNSNHWMKKHPNLIEHITVHRPEQVWVSDITYIKSDEGHHYLSLVTDAYSKRIMGHELSRSLSLEGPLKALNMAIGNKKYSDQKLIHHSDRGLQYCSMDYVSKLLTNQIDISMTQNGDPYENAIAERVNGILKYEFLMIDGFKDYHQAVAAIKDSIKIYNQERPHLSCRMLTPNQAHQQNTMILKTWNKKPRKPKAPEVQNTIFK
jgi:transposase InsO family protein